MSGNLIAIIVILVLLLVLAGIFIMPIATSGKNCGIPPGVIRNGLLNEGMNREKRKWK